MSLLLWQRPWAFLFILPLLILLWWMRHKTPQAAHWQKQVDPHLLPFLIVQQGTQRRSRQLVLFALIWLLAIIALAGPSVQRPDGLRFQREISRVLLVDLSPTMLASDVKPTRLARARLKMLDWLAAQNEGQTALMVYGGSAHVVVPLSTDARTISALIPSLDSSLIPVAGDDPVTAFQRIEQLRRDSGLMQVDVLWITDGFDRSYNSALLDVIHNGRWRVSLLAVGSPDGAPVQLPDNTLFKDEHGNVVLAKTDLQQLSQLASQTQMRFAQLQADDSDWKSLQWPAQWQDTFERIDEDDRALQWRDLGGWLCLLILPLLLWHWRQAHWIFVGAVLLQMPSARADIFHEWFSTPDQRGQQAFEAKQFEEASRQFEQTEWRGASHFRAGQYDKAIQDFSYRDNAENWYNRGNALAKNNQLQEAVRAYDEAIKKKPDFVQAKENREAVLKALKKNNKSSSGHNANNSQENQSSQSNKQDEAKSADQANDSSQGQRDAQASSTADASQTNKPTKSAKTDSSQTKNAQQNATQQSPSNPPDENKAGQNAELTTTPAKPLDARSQQLLKQLPDDPGGLLRRKMQVELARRRQESFLREDIQDLQ